MTTCDYDTGSMYDCRPACLRPATVTLEYLVPCYGWFTSHLCERHLGPMLGRVYPSEHRVTS